MTIGDEKVVAYQYLFKHREDARWMTCELPEYRSALRQPDSYQTRMLVNLNDYQELEAQRADLWREKRDLLGSIDVDCATIETLRMELAASQSAYAELAAELAEAQRVAQVRLRHHEAAVERVAHAIARAAAAESQLAELRGRAERVRSWCQRAAHEYRFNPAAMTFTADQLDSVAGMLTNALAAADGG